MEHLGIAVLILRLQSILTVCVIMESNIHLCHSDDAYNFQYPFTQCHSNGMKWKTLELRLSFCADIITLTEV